jgi:hypothetical protein
MANTQHLETAENKPGKIEKFLWWCSGGDEDLLTKYCPPSDKVKYFGMGGVVLATGVLAAISSGYAFYTIFGPKGDAVDTLAQKTGGIVGANQLAVIAAAVFGILWGLMIFNLDRFIVSAGGKGDLKEGFSFWGKNSDLSQSWPRFLMAIILGIVISKPLEVRIMQTEINAELSAKQEKYEFTLNKQSDSLIDAKIAVIRSRLSPVEKDVSDNQKYVEQRRLEIKEQRKQLELEAEGKTGSGTAGRGPAWKDKKENLDKMEVELEKLAQKYAADEQALKQRIQGYEKEIAALDMERVERQKKNKERAHQLDGLIERIKIAHDIGGKIPLFLMLMFIIIEITPLLFKMMMTKTPYDYLSENKNAMILANNGIIFNSEPHKDDSGKEVVTPVLVERDIVNHKKMREQEIIRQQLDNYNPGT